MGEFFGNIIVFGGLFLFFGFIIRTIIMGRMTYSYNTDISSDTEMKFNYDIKKDVGAYSFLVSKCHTKLAILFLGAYRVGEPKLLNIGNMRKVELVVNDSVVTSGGITRAIVGGAIAGGAGAIVGSNTAKQVKSIDKVEIKIFTTDVYNPVIAIPIWGGSESKHLQVDKVVEQADELVETINLIIEDNKEKGVTYTETQTYLKFTNGSSFNGQSTSSNTWTCDKCSTKNNSSSVYCSGCGEYKY